MRAALLVASLLLPACSDDCGELGAAQRERATAQRAYDAAIAEVTAGTRTLDSVDPEHDVLHDATAKALDLEDRC